MVHNQVPVNWRKFPLSQIAEVRFSNVDKKTMPGETAVLLCNYLDVYNNNYISRDLDFMEATATDAEIERFKVQSGDVIITKDSETPDDIGIPAVVIQEIRNLICGYHLALIKPNRNLVDSAFLAKQIGQDRIQRYFSRLANGMTRFGLTASVIENTPIWLAPVFEQHKVAKILSTIDELTNITQSLIAKYNAIKQGMMQDLFTRGIDEGGRLRPIREEAVRLYKDTKFGWLPSSWRLSRFAELIIEEDIAEIQDGNHGELHPKSTDFVQCGVPFIMANDIRNNELDIANCHYISRNQYLSLRIGFSKTGDVLLTHKGTIGLTAVVPEDIPEIMLTPQVTYYRTGVTGRISPRFLFYYFQTGFVQSMLQQLSEQTTRKYIGISEQKRLPCIVPPTDEQDKIADILGGIDRTVKYFVAEAEKLKCLKSGLMQDLLTGKVRVNVDESTESERDVGVHQS
jgi:type I restriction enzyme, S subunit